MHPFEGRAIYDPVTELLVTSILISLIQFAFLLF